MPWRREREKEREEGRGEEGKEENMKREITSTNHVLYSSNMNHTQAHRETDGRTDAGVCDVQGMVIRVSLDLDGEVLCGAQS